VGLTLHLCVTARSKNTPDAHWEHFKRGFLYGISNLDGPMPCNALATELSCLFFDSR